jgi:hypothetical protein
MQQMPRPQGQGTSNEQQPTISNSKLTDAFQSSAMKRSQSAKDV